MMRDQNNQADRESRLNEMGEENQLLLLQLHHVQEELERYYLRNQTLEKARPADSESNLAPGKGWVDDELLNALTESQRLCVLVEVQRKVHRLESQNSLNAKLGDILIQGADSPMALLALPGKLGRIWRTYNRQMPPKSLGGNGFGKVVAAYSEGGFDVVEKLMIGTSIPPAIQANGYTAVARHLMLSDHPNAAEAARRAYALDPKPYRLKWLAFRLHEAGDVIEAEAMLDILPSDTQFSDSEARQAGQLRYEANHVRQRDAKQKTEFSERRAEIEGRMKRLVQERDEQSQLVTERTQEVEVLTQAKAQLEQEKLALAGQHEEGVKLVVERTQEAEVLKRAKAQLEQEKLALAGQHEEAFRLVVERTQEVEVLERAKAQLEQEKLALAGQHDEAARRVVERTEELEVLTQAKAQLDQEK
jgi:hypothetical protein